MCIAMALVLVAGLAPTIAFMVEAASGQEWTVGMGIAPEGIPLYGFRRSAGDVKPQ